MLDKQAKISLREPDYAAYAQIYKTRFYDEVVYWADSQKVILSVEEYAMGRMHWVDKERYYERIIYIGERAIGTVTAREIDWERRSCLLGIVIAVPEYWGKGYGTKVLKQFFVLLYDLGIKFVRLETFSNNIRARRCFEGLGFKKRRSFYAPQSGRFVIEMVKKLEPIKPIGYVVKGGRSGKS
ncbi:MAG: GNAT family N-acetyltransferase [Bradymonadales bacterium]|jgi:RimJ/RimL family protein N-acetyltransferase